MKTSFQYSMKMEKVLQLLLRREPAPATLANPEIRGPEDTQLDFLLVLNPVEQLSFVKSSMDPNLFPKYME